MKKASWVIIFFVMFLAGCMQLTEDPPPPTSVIITLESSNTIPVLPSDISLSPPEYLPRPSDKQLIRANAFPKSIDLLAAETFPLQLKLVISGYLPTPCHQLRVYIPPPDINNNIKVEVYSVADPNITCEQVLRAFNTPVILGNYPSHNYLIWVNGEMVGDFDS